MTARRSRLLAAVSITAVVAATALTSAGSASATSSSPRLAAAPVPITHANGLIAYSCIGQGVSTRKGWLLNNGARDFDGDIWSYGTYYGGVDWAPDGSEMSHDAQVTEQLYGYSSQHTVFLSEQSEDRTAYAAFDYPSQDTNFSGTSGVIDSETTFTADGGNVLFARNDGSGSKIESIPAGGGDTPFELPQPGGDNAEPAASVTGDIAFTNRTSTVPIVASVFILSSGSNTPVDLGLGLMPKFSPDGSLIAFVNTGGTLSTKTTDGNNVAAAGPTAYGANIRDFAWSPDGTKFVFGLGDNSVRTAPVTAGSTLTTVPATTPCTVRGGQVSWQPVPTTGHEDQVVRVWGSTRQDTSVATSHAGFPTPGSADAVVLADSYHFPDALSGAPLATHVHGPMLLTPGSAATVWPSVLSEIDRVTGDKTKPIYLLGLTGSVSQGIQDQLTGLGYTHIVRLGGANRYETSLAIANFMGHDATAPEEILLATGTDFPDGLSAGAAAASYWPGGGPGGAVLLTNGSRMYPAVQTYITNALVAQTASRHV